MTNKTIAPLTLVKHIYLENKTFLYLGECTNNHHSVCIEVFTNKLNFLHLEELVELSEDET